MMPLAPSLDPEKLRGSERSRAEIRQIADKVLNNRSIGDVMSTNEFF